MAAAGTSFAGAFGSCDVVAAYDSLLVPRLFNPWADLLLDRIQASQGELLCDIACGPGTVARAAARRLGPRGRVIAADLSAAMLDAARAMEAEPGAAPIDFRLSPAAPLDVDSGAADVVTCQQGLQFFPDPDAALGEMRRVLGDGGRLGIACWRPIEECPIYHALERTLAAVIGAERARALRQPFSGPPPGALAMMLEKAGFRDAVISEEERDLTCEGGVAMALSILDATPFRNDVSGLDADGRAALHAVGARELSPFLDRSGAVRAPMRSVVASACA